MQIFRPAKSDICICLRHVDLGICYGGGLRKSNYGRQRGKAVLFQWLRPCLPSKAEVFSSFQYKAHQPQHLLASPPIPVTRTVPIHKDKPKFSGCPHQHAVHTCKGRILAGPWKRMKRYFFLSFCRMLDWGVLDLLSGRRKAVESD